jgi:ATP-dependent helicase HrpB
LRRLPLPPRLARMVIDAARLGQGALAAEIATLIGERGLGGDGIDMRERLAALRRDRSPRARDARHMAQRWAEIATPDSGPCPQEAEQLDVGALIALAFPERIGKNRGGGAGASTGAFLLANGRGANLDAASPLARAPFLAVAELAGSAAQGRILSAAPITLAEIEAHFADRITSRDEVVFDAGSLALRGRKSQRLGAIVLAEQPVSVAPGEQSARLLAEGIAKLGIDRLPWTKPLKQWRDRVMFLRRSEGATSPELTCEQTYEQTWPDLADTALAARAGEWLAPALAGKTALGEFTADEFAAALAALLPWSQRRRLDAEAPIHFEAPTGSRVPIDYDSEGGPKIAIRVQELFGLDRHPAIAGGKVPLAIELLSPAQRPVQTTRDLPGFWRGSYAAVRAEMRGRYPKHPWPEDPLAAAPTRRAKPRKS